MTSPVTAACDHGVVIERDRFVVEQVRGRGIPLVVNLAGGYVRGVSERLHVNTIRAMASPLPAPRRTGEGEVVAPHLPTTR